MGKIKVEIDADACIGCGVCVAACESNFEMNGDKAKVKSVVVQDSGCSKAAADGCPVSCIKLTKLK